MFLIRQSCQEVKAVGRCYHVTACTVYYNNNYNRWGWSILPSKVWSLKYFLTVHLFISDLTRILEICLSILFDMFFRYVKWDLDYWNPSPSSNCTFFVLDIGWAGLNTERAFLIEMVKYAWLDCQTIIFQDGKIHELINNLLSQDCLEVLKRPQEAWVLKLFTWLVLSYEWCIYLYSKKKNNNPKPY